MCKRLLLFGVAMWVVCAAGAAMAADVTAPGNVVQGVPNDGDWPGNEAPPNAIDDNVNTKFLHFKGETQPTGIRVTPSAAGSIVDALTFTTANDAVERDPVAFEFYGSNVSIDGPYTLIASGPIVDFAGATAWPRFTKNTTPITFSNKTPYNHYQILITAVRNPAGANSMQVAEIELLGQVLKAHQPDPADKAILNATSKLMTWSPGAYAAQHRVYFGTNATAVANGTGGTDRGLQASATYLAIGLVPGTTYYWRVDEVNDVHPDSPWTGDVWSFDVASVKAWYPSPADGAVNVVKNSVLSWRAGLGAIASYVYMGTSPTNLQQKTLTSGTTYTPTGQADGTTYYWRIDSIDNSMNIVTGDVWSYTTIPFIAITDPNLRGWWTFDEGSGTVVLDQSGHGNHGIINGNPTWIDGYDGGALRFDGDGDWIECGSGASLNLVNELTVAAWVNPAVLGRDHKVAGNQNNSSGGYKLTLFNDNQVEFEIRTSANAAILTRDVGGGTPFIANDWQHVAGTYSVSSGHLRTYLNGVLQRVLSTTEQLGPGGNFRMGREIFATSHWFQGAMDDVRVYDEALDAAGITLIMRGDPNRAWNPNPVHGVSVSIDGARVLSWSAGDSAVQHDVYFGTDAATVEAASVGDPMGVYKGRQAGTTYNAPVVMGATYFWRIDEVNNDSSITKGRVWRFTVLSYLIVDDFESYGDVAVIGVPGQRIWYVWLDGLGYNNPPPGYAGNGSGSMVDLSTAVVNSGQRAMRMDFDNTTVPYSVVEAATSNLLVGSNWNRDGVKALALSFRGYPPSTGGVTVNGGQLSVRGSGADIWDVLYPGEVAADGYHDEFHFVYITLAPGTHTIQAKVESLVNTNGWAKVGVMMRTSLNPKSSHTIAGVTPSNGLAQQWRLSDGAASAWGDTNRDAGALAPATAPAWVRLTRQVDGSIEARYSMDGATWTLMHSNAGPMVPMNPPSMYLGLAVCSHNAAATTTAVFSNVTVNGNPFTGYSNQDIGILSNSTDPLYVILKSGATSQRVIHPNPAAIQNATFQQWNIAISDFSPVPAGNVTNIGVGTGTPGGALGKTGTIYVDDIRLYPPRYVAGKLTPWAEDMSDNGDGVVDLRDVDVLVADWLDQDSSIASVNPGTGNLIAYYTLDNTTNDSSGFNRHGTAVGSPTYAGGQVGQAINLNGSQYVLVDANAVDMGIGGAAAKTIAGWAYVRSFNNGGLWDLGTNADGQDFSLRTTGTRNFWRTQLYGGAYDHDFRCASLNEWVHFAQTYDGTTSRVYANGTLVASAARTLNTTGTKDFSIGRWSGNMMDGLMDDVRIYNKALSQAEVAYLVGGPGTVYLPLMSVAEISETEVQGGRIVNFKDLAVLLGKWLQTQVWPAP